jgi:hypothetical protein
MKYFKLALSLLFLLIIFTSSVTTGASSVRAQTGESTPEFETGVYTPGVDDPAMPLAISGFTDIAMQGTAWVEERPWRFFSFRYWGWGTETKAKLVTDEWVHIAIPYATYIDSSQLKISHVEFCAQSTAGVRTKPVAWHLWANGSRFATYNINWPADNLQHCAWVNYPTPFWKEALGYSVKLHYANTADKITLFKAWVRLVP